MKILIADDSLVARAMLQDELESLSHEVIVATNGLEAWNEFQSNNVQFVITDWTMPEIDGLELCKRIRSVGGQTIEQEQSEVESKAWSNSIGDEGTKLEFENYVYIIILTAKDQKTDLIEGMNAGADDFITKPFDMDELRSRIRAGERILNLKTQLTERIRELEHAVAHIKQLQGILPICSYCKKIRDDKDYWHQVEGYLQEHMDVMFSHSICPECYEKRVKPMLNR